MEELFLPNKEDYFVSLDIDVDEEDKYYDVESNIWSVSPEKKVKKIKKENIIVNKIGYKYLLIVNFILTIQFLVFLAYFAKTTHLVKNDENVNNLNSRRLRSDNSINPFINIHRKEIANSKKRNYNNIITMKVMKLINPPYIDSLKSKRLIQYIVRQQVTLEK